MTLFGLVSSCTADPCNPDAVKLADLKGAGKTFDECDGNLESTEFQPVSQR